MRFLLLLLFLFPALAQAQTTSGYQYQNFWWVLGTTEIGASDSLGCARKLLALAIAQPMLASKTVTIEPKAGTSISLGGSTLQTVYPLQGTISDATGTVEVTGSMTLLTWNLPETRDELGRSSPNRTGCQFLPVEPLGDFERTDFKLLNGKSQALILNNVLSPRD